MNPRLALLTFGAALVLAGCSQNEAAPAPPLRPVLSVVASAHAPDTASFVGTVQPRFSHDLGFRVLGRVAARDVSLGQTVKKDQVLASLDPTTLALPVRQLEAQLEKARAQLVYATATRDRKKALLAKNVASQADLDAAEDALATASAAVTQAKASLDKAKEQLSYTKVLSQTDGVITAVNAEVGQTVNAGDTVFTVAQTGDREAVIDLPDETAQLLKPGEAFEVTLQVDPAVQTRGHVREIAPQADAATRTRRIRITLDAPPAAFRLGTTIVATPVEPEGTIVDLPASALLMAEGRSFVWVVDVKAETVSRRPVEVLRKDGGRLQIKSGIQPGERIVTAGANSLTEGQTVKVDPEMLQ